MLLSSLLHHQNQLTSEGSKFDNLMNNFPGNPNKHATLPGSGSSSPATIPHLDQLQHNNMTMMGGSSAAVRPGQKRPADEAGMGMGMGMNIGAMGMNNSNSNNMGMDNSQLLNNQGGTFNINERPTKRPFMGTSTPMTGPTGGPTGNFTDDKLASPINQTYPLRNNLMSASLVRDSLSVPNPTGVDAAQQRLADYQSTLLASSLANGHAELAQRQLLTRYFTPQFRLNSLSTSLAAPPPLGLGSLTGHQLPGTTGAGTAGGPGGVGSAGPGGLAALLSRNPNQQDPLQSMAARFQQQQQQHQQGGGVPPQQSPRLGSAASDTLQCLPAAASVGGGSGHRSDRLQDAGLMMGAGAVGAGSGAAAAGLQGMHPSSHSMLASVADMQSAAAAGAMGAGAAGALNDESVSPIPLGIDEDPNWLSDFHVFVRKNLVELCWASSEDVALRNASNRVSSHQVGIRCRCCAHLNPSARAQRSSAFPSSIAQIYQSFTMMLRAHFSSCTEVPPHLKEKFLALKSKTTQGATDSKQYWIYSARRLGMVDSDDGIVMTKATTTAARALPPFGSNPQTGRGGEASSAVPLVAQSDRQIASDFLYHLMQQSSRVRLQANEQRGNKKSLQLGLPGFACRHCCQLGRMGQCRIFPARRRTLPTKIYDLYEHLMRCTACPQETKDLLEMLHDRENYQPKTPGHKEFLDLIWSRLVEQQHA